MRDDLKRKRNRKKKSHLKSAKNQLTNPIGKSVTLLSTAIAVSSMAPIAAFADETATDKNTLTTNGDTYEALTADEVTITSEEGSVSTTSTSELVEVTSEKSITETVEASAESELPELVDLIDGVSSMSLASSPAEFVASVANYAQQVANANDLYASVMIAQACLESGYGNSSLAAAPNHNLFGIKGNYNGESVTMRTAEQDASGNVYYVNAAFRKYPTYGESFQDNANVLRNTSFSAGVYYYAGAWKSNTTSYQQATAYLTGRYATDVNYGTKLNRIIELYNLTQYDTETSGGGTTQPSVPGVDTGSSNSNNSGTTTGTTGNYTVVSGDTLWAISQKYGVSVADLKAWNNLSSDNIKVGQRLNVGTGGNAVTPAPTPSTPSENTGSGTTTTGNYTVVSGDTLWAISQKYGVSVADLKAWNNLSSDNIKVGQKLNVGTGGNAVTPAPTPSTPSENTGSSTTTTGNYTVVSGDTLWAISQKYGVSVADLKVWNNLSSDNIRVGQKLNVGTGGSAVVTPPTLGSITNNAGSTTTTSNYTVVSGDTLWAISQKNGVSVADLKSWNSLSSDNIKVGQVLQLKKAVASTPQTTNVESYKVVSGDTLWNIAKQHNLSVSALKALNNLTSDLILLNQTLKLK